MIAFPYSKSFAKYFVIGVYYYVFGGANSAFYTKVSNKLLSDIGTCLLPTPNAVITSRYQCLNQCETTTNCYLTCFNGSSCLFYNASVSSYWNASSTSFATAELVGFECYSLYYVQNDITNRIVSTKTATGMPTYLKEYAINGYYCSQSIDIFHSNGFIYNPWYEIDLGQVYKVSKVIIKTRSHIDTFFTDIEVRVGNVSGNGDFTKNALFALYVGYAALGEVVIFEGSTPLYGRYVSLQKLYNQMYLVIPDLKIIT